MKEPERLKDETNSIQEQIQELAVTNYKTFIETAECSRELFKQFNTIENKLDNLIENIPKFEEECKIFAEKSSDINDLRKLTSLTLTKNAQLLEILELPQLMNSFINDGLYEDALELASHVRKLYNKHPDIPIFKVGLFYFIYFTSNMIPTFCFRVLLMMWIKLGCSCYTNCLRN